MSTNKIFGGWDTKPENGSYDHLAALWHILAAQGVGCAEMIPNFGLSQRRSEITMLWQLYERAKPEVVLEIGVAQGGTFAGWCILGRDDATLIACDRDLNDAHPRPGNPVHPSIYNGPLGMTDQGGGVYHLRQRRQKIHTINGWSHEPATISRLMEILDGRKIDWLMNDASHEASMAQRDWEIYWPLVADGGVYVSHDICRSDDPKCNKKQWWDKVVAQEDYSAVFELKPGRNEQNMGLGILVK